jgi:hypothetical protein
MNVYRLVNCDHDPITVGATLIRGSDHSRQKLGPGMYFAISREAALEFAKTRHGHTYTHLLTCRLKGITEKDFVDLVKEPFVISRSEFKALPYDQRGSAYCAKHGKKGIIWKAIDWVEVCLFAQHIGDSVIVESVEMLPASSEPNAAL